MPRVASDIEISQISRYDSDCVLVVTLSRSMVFVLFVPLSRPGEGHNSARGISSGQGPIPIPNPILNPNPNPNPNPIPNPNFGEFKYPIRNPNPTEPEPNRNPLRCIHRVTLRYAALRCIHRVTLPEPDPNPNQPEPQPGLGDFSSDSQRCPGTGKRLPADPRVPTRHLIRMV